MKNSMKTFIVLVVLQMSAAMAWGEIIDNVKYIDANGNEQVANGVTVLDGSETTLGTDEATSWYVTKGDLSYNCKLVLIGDVHLILADGTSMTVYNETANDVAIYVSDNLIIYGQTVGTGQLNATGDATAISADTDNLIDTEYENDITINGGIVNAFILGNGACLHALGDIVINGGQVTAGDIYDEELNYYGIIAASVTINGGVVSAAGKGSIGYGIYAVGAGQSDITINGGQVTAYGDYFGMYSDDGDIILSWTKSADYICSNSYFVYPPNVLKIPAGKYFSVYGTIYGNADEDYVFDAEGNATISKINDKTLVPYGDEATGIENLTPTLSEGEGVLYDLQGRRVNKPTKGMYIVDGKKVFVK